MFFTDYNFLYFSKSSLWSHRKPYLPCIVSLPCVSTEWSCSYTMVKQTGFQRWKIEQMIGRIDQKFLFINCLERGNNSSRLVWRAQDVEIRLLDLNLVGMKDEWPIVSTHDKSFLYFGIQILSHSGLKYSFQRDKLFVFQNSTFQVW